MVVILIIGATSTMVGLALIAAALMHLAASRLDGDERSGAGELRLVGDLVADSATVIGADLRVRPVDEAESLFRR